MIVDTSAMIAILAGEPERDAFIEAILHSPDTRLSAANFLETSIVIDRTRDPVVSRRLDELIATLGIEIVDATPAQARIARAAYRDYGHGSGHPAQLNFGDCFAYALATDTADSLLFKGQDFVHTDVRPAA